jgi:hypothetical protein
LDIINSISMFSKFKEIDDIAISDLLGSVPSSYSEAIKKLSLCNNSIDNSLILDNRSKLQFSIKNFHLHADTMTEDVTNSIKLLNDPNTQIFASTHQPNLFAYGGIFRKILLNQTFKNDLEGKFGKDKKKIVNLFIIVDHDFMDEIWVRRAQMPSFQHSGGIMNLKYQINRSNRWHMICNNAIPYREVLDYWEGQIYSWIKNLSTSLHPKIDKTDLLANFKEFWREVEISYSNAKTYSDFNSFLISRIVNRIWKYDTLFAKVTSLSLVFKEGFRYLLSNFDKYSESLRKAENLFLINKIYDSGIRQKLYSISPFWIHCNCGGKASSIIQYNNNHKQSNLSGTCISCKKSLNITLEDKNAELSNDDINKVSPRAIPILLLLSKCLDINCYVSGTGGINYMLYGSLAFKELDIKIPINVFWPARDISYGIGQLEALQHIGIKKQSDIIMYLDSLREKEKGYKNKIKPLIDERTEKVKSGQPIQKLLLELFILKESQREIRKGIKVVEKVTNAVNLMPCIIDYAINFGIGTMESLWRENLIKNDNFELPVVLR